MSYEKVQLVNLSNLQEAKQRNKAGVNCYYSEEYRGLDYLARAKKAALSVSNNGACWWLYNKVYGDLVHKFNYEKRRK